MFNNLYKKIQKIKFKVCTLLFIFFLVNILPAVDTPLYDYISIYKNWFKPKITSPCLDVGADTTAIVTVDFDNESRPQQAAVDIGAFEIDQDKYFTNNIIKQGNCYFRGSVGVE